MVTFLSDTITKLFQNISSEQIIQGHLRYDAIPLSLVQQICYAVDGSVSEEALDKKLRYLREWMYAQLKDEHLCVSSAYQTADYIGIFDMVRCITSLILWLYNRKMVYRYEHLDAWNRMSGKLGRNMFLASAYAVQDSSEGFHRTSYIEMDVTRNDNEMFNQMLDRGMSENHFHLRVSSPYFIMSWISLMNSVISTDRIKYVKKIKFLDDSPRNTRVQYQNSYQETSFKIRHLKAALIRVYLYAVLTGQVVEFGHYDTSIPWLLNYLLCAEPVTQQLHEDGTQRDEDVLLTEYIESICDDMECFQRTCPGTYWFFWRRFPYIPSAVLKNKDRVRTPVFCDENVRVIASYIEEKYEPFPLRHCAWLFEGRGQQVYRREWNRRTLEMVLRILNDEKRLLRERSNLQHIIDGFRFQHQSGRKDYALTAVEMWKSSEWERAVTTGEKWLLYQMMYRQCQAKGINEHWDKLYNLFFAYLVIKESFRMEILQENEKNGFQNFQKYQKRKVWFNTGFSEGECARITVHETFRMQHLLSLELRIMPCQTSTELIRTIRYYDKHILHEDEPSAYGGRNESDAVISWPYYFVLHFGKKPDVPSRSDNFLRYRHEDFRRRLKQKAGSIMRMREKNPDIADRVRGIDACSSEDGCRPEVFAVAFRTLRAHMPRRSDTGKKMRQLRVCYHVGEFNQDILDGLRAIDEAVYFLNLKSGDRLGHATMLGFPPEKWYARDHYTVSIRQQDYLDNVVWLYHRIIHYHISNEDNLLEYLAREFETYFGRIYNKSFDAGYNEEIVRQAAGAFETYVGHIYEKSFDTGYNEEIVRQAAREFETYLRRIYEKSLDAGYNEEIVRQAAQKFETYFGRIYEKALDAGYNEEIVRQAVREYVRQSETQVLNFNIHNYYSAWELRGDHPALYQDGYYKETLMGDIWSEHAVNKLVKRENRYSMETVILYYTYHYNAAVRERGSMPIVREIPPNMVRGIALVQKAMQRDIAERGIVIEANPSSNLKIAGLDSYASHPMVAFYNKGLTNDAQKLSECPQLSVSINTDDQGLFTTSLCNEYALMASALENLKKEDGTAVFPKHMVYEWLDNIRQMGNDQSFGSNLLNKERQYLSDRQEEQLDNLLEFIGEKRRRR